MMEVTPGLSMGYSAIPAHISALMSVVFELYDILTSSIFSQNEKGTRWLYPSSLYCGVFLWLPPLKLGSATCHNRFKIAKAKHKEILLPLTDIV